MKMRTRKALSQAKQWPRVWHRSPRWSSYTGGLWTSALVGGQWTRPRLVREGVANA